MSEKANDRQVGGDHYSKAGKDEQHWDRVARLGLDYFQAQITKYVERCWTKNGIEDLRKAAHFLQKYIEVCEGRKGTIEELHERRWLALEQIILQQGEQIKKFEREQGQAPLQLNWLLQNMVVSEDGKLTMPDDSVHDCLKGHPLNISTDFVFEGAYGSGRVMWTCVKCRDKVYTQGAQLPHALHRSCSIDDFEPAAEPQAHGYVDQDSDDLSTGPHTVVLPDKPTS